MGFFGFLGDVVKTVLPVVVPGGREVVGVVDQLVSGRGGGRGRGRGGGRGTGPGGITPLGTRCPGKLGRNPTSGRCEPGWPNVIGCPPGLGPNPTTGNCERGWPASLTTAMASFAPETICLWPWRIDPTTGKCDLFIGDVEGPDRPGGGNGMSLVTTGGSRVPDTEMRRYRSCERGMVLGYDGWCYSKREISNKNRMWPKARRPLMTGGDLNAITTANRAAKRLQAKQKQLQNMGMLKRPAPRARRSQASRSPIHGGSLTVIDTE